MPHVKKVALPVALAAALAGQPLTRAADVEKPPTLEQTAKDVQELKAAQKKSTDTLMDELKKIQEQLKSMDGVRKDVDGLKTTVQSINVALNLTTEALKAKTNELAETQATLKQVHDDLERARAQAGKMQEQIAAHSARCDGLNAEIAQLNKKLADTTRQAARLTEGTGTIRLYNTYAMPVDVVVNRRAYHLEPGETYTLASQPMGTFTYEVLGIQPPRTEMLTAERPFDIEVFDRNRGPIRTPPKPLP